MKRLSNVLTIIVLIFPMLLLSCDELFDDFLSYDTDFDEIYFTIPPTDQTGEISQTICNNEDLDSYFQDIIASNATGDMVEIKSIMLKILNEDTTCNFDALESAEVILSSGSLPEVIIAKLENVPEGLRTISLNVLDVDIIEYLREPGYLFVVNITNDDIISQAIDIHGIIKFTINIFGNDE